MARKRGNQKPRGGKGSKNNTPHRAQPKHTPRGPRFRADEVATFSLQDEAKWASSHRSSAFSADKKLRFLKIEFVSAGHLEGTLKDKAPVSRLPPASPESPAGSDTSSPTAAAAMAKMAINSPSPAASPSGSSSEDEVVFRGRNGTGTPVSRTETPLSTAQKESLLPKKQLPESVKQETRSAPVETVPELAAPSSTADRTSPSKTAKGKQPAVEDEQSGSESDKSVLSEGFEKRLGGQSKWMVGTTPWVSRSKPGIGWLPVKDRPDMDAFLDGRTTAKEAAEDDYMQNIRDEILGQDGSSFRKTFAQRPLDLDDDDSDAYRAEFDEEDEDDEDDEDEDKAETSRVFDAEEANLFDALAGGEIDFGGSDMSDIFIADSAEEDDDDDGEDDDDESEDSEDSENENDVNADMDDERLARVLQQQEELGLGSDEILLYGADDFFDGPIDHLLSDRPRKNRQSRHGAGRGGRGGRKEPTFASASALADALDADPYGGFDVMDTERPSLRPIKRGRRGTKPPELSDSDLNEQLHSTWERDRAKKRMKKAEREELRKSGMLGRKGKAPDLSVKYKDNIDMNDLVEEIRDWMFSDLQQLPLPPMEAHRRAVVHQMVHQLGVNSKSRGQGNKRFTVLSKTSRTKTVEHSFFDALITQKRFRARFSQVSTRVGAKGGKNVSAHKGYKDGEVVGAKAAELGPENKGRVLLEKMGWSKGMALGAMDNKGILHPIAATLKTGKAGLG